MSAKTPTHWRKHVTPSASSQSVTCNANVASTVPKSDQDMSNQLLQRIAEQLAAQTKELQHIRRTAEACHSELSLIGRCTRQLVVICQVTAQAASALAVAAAEFMTTSETAQQTARLQLAVGSGRLAMLLLLVLLGTFTASSAVWSNCTVRKVRAARQVQQLMSGLLSWPQSKQHSRWFLARTSPSMGWCLMSTAGRFITGQACFVLWSLWAWKHCSASAAAAALNSTPGAAAVPAADPFISLLLAALPCTGEQLSAAAVLLPAALYEGLFGAAAVALVSGRWTAWLLLWELWLWCCYINSRRSRCLNKALQPEQVHAAAYSRPVACSSGQQQQQQQLLAQHSSLGHSSSMSWLAFWLHRPVMLAAVQLLLPVLMAVVAVWR